MNSQEFKEKVCNYETECLQEIVRLKVVYSENPLNSPRIKTQCELASIAKQLIDDDSREVLLLFIFDVKNRPQAFYRLTTGHSNGVSLNVHELLKATLLHNGKAISLIHNHPSGDATPSKADMEMFDKVKNICKLVNLRFNDSIVLGFQNYFSCETLDYFDYYQEIADEERYYCGNFNI